MKRFIFLPLMTYFLLMNAMAANGENNPSNLLGAPVNTAISGGSVLPVVIEDSLRFDRQTGIINCGFLYQ